MVEIGGMKKNFGRTEPGFLMQAEAHRNMAFSLYQAWQMPQVEVDTINTPDFWIDCRRYRTDNPGGVHSQ